MVYIVPVYSDATQGESKKKGKREKQWGNESVVVVGTF